MKAQLFYYLTLVILLMMGVFAFWYARGNPASQLAVGLATSGAYVLWGIIYHASRGDLHRKVVIEYLLIAVLASLLLASMLGRFRKLI